MAKAEGTYPDLPLAVLVNDTTASASEIVAGALRDHNRAVIIGERTLGKGSVQNLIELEEQDSAIKLTTAYYYLPSGELIHRIPGAEKSGKWGVEPPIEIKLTNEETLAIIKSRRRSNVLEVKPVATTARAGSGERQDGSVSPVVDRQLEQALIQLRVKLHDLSGGERVGP